jgi:hypothetical protein
MERSNRYLPHHGKRWSSLQLKVQFLRFLPDFRRTSLHLLVPLSVPRLAHQEEGGVKRGQYDQIDHDDETELFRLCL